MARRLFTLCSALSLLLCVAVCVLWVRSYWVSDFLQRHDRRTTNGRLIQRTWFVMTGSGGVGVGRTQNDHPLWLLGAMSAGWPNVTIDRVRDFVWEVSLPARPAVPPGLGTRRAGPFEAISARVTRGPARQMTTAVNFPFWLPAILFALPPARWWAIRLRRLRGVRAGRCGVCGYDLRATPDRCPECGHTPEEAPA